MGTTCRLYPFLFSLQNANGEAGPGVLLVQLGAEVGAALGLPVPGCDLGSSGHPLASPARGAGRAQRWANFNLLMGPRWLLVSRSPSARGSSAVSQGRRNPSRPERLFINSPECQSAPTIHSPSSQEHIFSITHHFEDGSKLLFTLLTGSCFSKLQSAGRPRAKALRHLLKLAWLCGRENLPASRHPLLLPRRTLLEVNQCFSLWKASSF